MKRIEVDTDWHDEPSPSGSQRQGYVTYEETEQYLVDQIRGFIRSKSTGYLYLHGYPTLTVHHCWSGYSEYTVTSTWHEVGIEWDGNSYFFESTAEFFKALSEVEESGY